MWGRCGVGSGFALLVLILGGGRGIVGGGGTFNCDQEDLGEGN